MFGLWKAIYYQAPCDAKFADYTLVSAVRVIGDHPIMTEFLNADQKENEEEEDNEDEQERPDLNVSAGWE